MTLHALHVHSGNLFGGVESMLLTLVRHTGATSPDDASASVQSEFALCFDGRFDRELRAAGATVELVGSVRVSRPWTVWRARKRLAVLLSRRRPDVVLCHSDWSHAIFGPTVRAARLPLVRWLHGPPGGTAWLERWAHRTPPSMTICNSRFTADAFTSVRGPAPREIIYPPVPQPTLDSAAARARIRNALGVSDHTVVMLQVGRIEPGKGHPVLLGALSRLQDRTDWTAWEAGGAQRESELSYLGLLAVTAAHLGLAERVRFLGERSDIPALLAAADIYCQPNTAPDSFGITFVEALYAGLPVVTSAIGGATEIVNPSCGILLPPNDAIALSAALRQLLDDPSRRAALGSAGPARARAVSDPRRAVKQLADCLARVAAVTP